MEPRTQTSAGMESVNETVERAKAMVSTSSDTQAPSVSTLEAAPQRLSVPELPNTVTAMEEFTSVTPEMLAEQRAIDEKRNAVGSQGTDLYEGLLSLGTKGSATIEAERQAGIPQLSTDLTEIENELSSKMLRFRRDREKIEQGTGLTANQKSQTLSEVSRVQNRELADLETIRAARSNTLTNAQNLVNRKVELEFGDKIAQVNALKFIYDENKETLTKEEDKLFQKTIKREERAFEVAKTQFVQLEAEKAKYLTNAAQAGADNNTLKTIQGVKSLDELYTLDGIQSYALSPADKLDMKIKQRQYDMLGIQMQNEANQAAAAAAAAASGALTEAQLKLANDLRAEVNGLQEVKDAKNLEGDTAALIAALEQENGVGDIAAINSFQRLVVDPGVAVREGDVALLQSAMSFTDMAALKARGLVKGDKLTPEARKQMLELVGGVYNFRVGLVDENTEQIRTIAQEQGVDYGKYVGRNFKTFEEIKGGITPEAVVQFGVSTTDDYVNSVYSALGTDPAANPFGISLE